MNIFLGFWQVFSPLILGYTDNAVAVWNGLIVGAIILVLAWIRMLRPLSWANLTWVNLLLGAWLALSPFALGFAYVGAAKWNDITVGLSVLFFAGVGLLTSFTTEA